MEINEEVPFRFEELFFSRTDPHGIIQAGNSVFQRISQYSWPELIEKPHKVIRHPDMPRGVFWLLWDTINRGEPIGAYVKNRAKDGRYYWVFAIVTPVEGGFLSVRLKPSSPIFQIVQKEYQALVARERAEALKPADSAALLLARLSELGFPDYSSFMTATLAQEVMARDEQIGRPVNGSIRRFRELSEISQCLLSAAAQIQTSYTNNAHVSMNFQVQAARLGDAGLAIGEISKNFDHISADIKSNMNRFVASAVEVQQVIIRGLFLSLVARIQREVAAFCAAEAACEETGQDDEMRLLTSQMQTYQRSALDGLTRIALQASGFRGDCAEMKRLATGLEVTRIMGKVESARLNMLTDGLNGLLDELESLQNSIADGLRQIEKHNQRIQYDTEKLISESKRAAAA